MATLGRACRQRGPFANQLLARELLDRQLEIAARLDSGEDLRTVEAELIDPAAELSDDDRAGLWLFAWSYRESHPPPVRAN